MATDCCTSPTSECPASTPLSRTQTRTPAPVAPPQAQSRVTSPGHSSGSVIRSTASAGRLQAGRGSSSALTSSSLACRSPCHKRTRRATGLPVREDVPTLARPVAGVFPLSHQEIARDRYADLLREATQERLASIARNGEPAESTARLRAAALRWAAAVARGAIPKRPAVHPA